MAALFIAHGNGDARAEMARKLYCNRPDTARTGVDQDGLPGFKAHPVQQCLPHRNRHQRQRGAFRHAKFARLGGNMVFVHGGVFRIAAGFIADAAIAEIYRVARVEAADIAAHCFDHTGTIAAEDGGKFIGVINRFAAQLGVQRINPGGSEFDAYMSGGRELRQRYFAQLQYISAAGRGHQDCAHRSFQ
jgi:hypothetical protein